MPFDNKRNNIIVQLKQWEMFGRRNSIKSKGFYAVEIELFSLGKLLGFFYGYRFSISKYMWNNNKKLDL